MDDEFRKAETVEEPTTLVEAPTTENEVPQEEVEEKVETPSTEEEEAQPEAETEVGSKKTAQHRIKELTAKTKSLEEKIAELTGSVDSQRPQPQYTPQIQPGQEISPEQYALDVDARAASIVEQRLQQERALNRINSEVAESVRTYPLLDSKSDVFNEDLSEAVYGAVEAQSKILLGYKNGQPVYGVNPSVNVKGIIASMMKPYQKSLEKESGEAEVRVAKQVSRAALKPTQVRTVEKSASEKTLTELEKELGVVEP